MTVACDPKTLTALTESEFQVIIYISIVLFNFLVGEGCRGSSCDYAGTSLNVRDMSIFEFSNL